MSEVLLDRIRLNADGSLYLVVRIRPSDGVPPPSAAGVRLVARGGKGTVTLPAALAEDGDGEWSATVDVAPDAFDGLPADAVFLDCTVDVTLDGDVLSRRLGWDDAPSWLPYPTAGRMLSLTRVTS